VDEKGGWVYSEGWIETQLQRRLYRVPLEGGDVEQVTSQRGWHQAVLSADCAHFIDTHSVFMSISDPEI